MRTIWESRRLARISSLPEDEGLLTETEREYCRNAVSPAGSRAARLLAKKMLSDYFRHLDREPPTAGDIEIISNNGPPQVGCSQIPATCSVQLSMSHSSTHVACYLRIGEK